MKTIPALFVLFFAFTISAFAKASAEYDYGLPDLVEISGAQSSDDGDWIRYDGSWYHNINVPILRGQTIQFGKGLPVIGAKSSVDVEFLYWGRNNYQKFRAETDWKPSASKQESSRQNPFTPLALGFVILLVLWVIRGIAKPKNVYPPRSNVIW